MHSCVIDVGKNNPVPPPFFPSFYSRTDDVDQFFRAKSLDLDLAKDKWEWDQIEVQVIVLLFFSCDQTGLL